MNNEKFLNHVLIGQAIVYKGQRCRVTGAKKCEKGCSFRLLNLSTSEEIWTEDAPLLVDDGIQKFFAKKHTGGRISASGVLGRIRDGRYWSGLDYGCGVMLEHLEEMACRFYSGEVSAVDEFLQLYCLDECREKVIAVKSE